MSLSEKLFSRCERSRDEVVCEYRIWVTKIILVFGTTFCLYLIFMVIAQIPMAFAIQTAVSITFAILYVLALVCIMLYKRILLIDIRKKAFRKKAQIWKYDLPAKTSEYMYIKRFGYQVHIRQDDTITRYILLSCIDWKDCRHTIAEQTVEPSANGHSSDLVCWATEVAAEMGMECVDETILSGDEKRLEVTVAGYDAFWAAAKDRLIRAAQRAGFKLLVCGMLISAGASSLWCAEEDREIKYDYVTDTVTGVVNSVMGVLSGQKPIVVSPDNDASPDDFERDAIGRRVPKSTAVKSGRGLHSDSPL